METFPQTIMATVETLRAFLRRHVTPRRSLITLLLSLSFLFVCGVTGAAGHLADRMILYVHIAGLHMKSPDANLSMPLKEVKKEPDCQYVGCGTRRGPFA